MLQATAPGAVGATALLFLAVGIYAAQWWAERQSVRKLGSHAPRISTYLPLGLDIVGRVLRNNFHNQNIKSWQHWFDNTENYGTLEAAVLGQRNVFTADPVNIKAVLATQFEDFGKGPHFHNTWKQFLGDSVFTTDGRQWHESRQLIRPMFLKDKVSNLEVMEQHVQTLLGLVATESQDGTVDISDLIFRYTLDVATDFLLGESVGSMDLPTQSFELAFAQAQHIQGIIARTGPAHFLIPRKSFNKSVEDIDAFIKPYIKSALALKGSELAEKSQPEYTFLHALASYTDDPQMIRDQLVSILIAGRDTTASALSWVFFEFARHPHVVEKLRKEIADSVGLNCPSYTELKDMKYLQNVIRETLRLYPIIPFNVREALRDTHLPRGGGPDGLSPIGIPKGTPIYYSPLFLHRQKAFYPPGADYLTFRPERWETWQPDVWSYLPFNGGPRICIGQQFALTEMAYTITRLMQHFDRVESRMSDTEPVLATNISVRPKQAVLVRLREAGRS